MVSRITHFNLSNGFAGFLSPYNQICDNEEDASIEIYSAELVFQLTLFSMALGFSALM